AESPARYEIDGLAIHDQAGDGSEPLVVIVHGGMDRSSSFGRVVRLMPEVPIRRYDRRGYGGSGAGDAVSLERHVQDLLTVIGDRCAVVFGHSIGGTIALATAAHRPDRICSLGLFESPSPWWSGTRNPMRERLEALDPGDAAERFMSRMAGERVWRRLPARTREARRSEGPALLADMAIAAEAAAIDPAMIRMPVIIGFGERSSEPRHEEAEHLASVLPESELHQIDGATHGVHLGDPPATADFIKATRRRCARA